jgi:hypothetical protein
MFSYFFGLYRKKEIDELVMEAVEKKPCKEETDEAKTDLTEKEKEKEKEEVVVSKKKTPNPKLEEG